MHTIPLKSWLVTEVLKMQGKKGWFHPLAHQPLNPPLSMGRDPQFKGESFDFINSVVVYGPFPIEILNCQC